MNTVTVEFANGRSVEAPRFALAQEFINEFGELEAPLAAVKINNEVCSLDTPILARSRLEPVLINTREGMNVYRRSLCFVLAVAAHELFPNERLVVGHSLGYAFYYTLGSLDKRASETDTKALVARMREIIGANESISTEFMSYEDAADLFSQSDRKSAALLLSFVNSPQIRVNECRGYRDLFTAPLALHSGILSTFTLEPYGEGFLLRYPPSSSPYSLTPHTDVPRLFSVYSQYKRWGRAVGVSCAGELNQRAQSREIKDYIEIAETLQNRRMAEIADMIVSKPSVKVVLIAGPSSSGKTTSSKKLSMQLRVMGRLPKVVELDNYFVDRARTPRDENGQCDYECLEALDLDLLNDNLLALFKGEEVDIPSYDFKTGERKFSGKKLRLEENAILILEGIHGLNGALTPSIPAEKKFKLYLSALAQLNIDDHNRIPTSDNRLIRRIVRDARFRGKTAAETIAMWPSVQRGERRYIFPFQNEADVMFNTALDYELGVLKVYAEPLLRAVKPMQKEYAEASRLAAFLNNFLPIPSQYVPGQSIVREFIGDSDFKY